MLTVLLTLVALLVSAPLLAASPDVSYVLGPDSPNREVRLQWPDGEPVSMTLRVYDARPSYVPGSIDPGAGASYQIGAWGSNPRTITFSHPDHDDIVVQWTYDPTHRDDPPPLDVSPDVSYVLGPDSPNREVRLQWPDGEPVSMTLRVYDARPSYVPGSIDPGAGASYQIGAWGSNPRAIIFSHPDHANAIVVQWSYDPDPVRVDPSPRPNIIVIFVDDLGYNDVSYNGATQITTANIDQLAASGVIFTNGFVNAPVCTPSRSGLLTGRYASRFGMDPNIPSWTPADPLNGLPLSEKTVASYLQGHGYRTGIVGKWMQGSHESLRPLERGFDYFFGFLTGSHSYWEASGDPADYDAATDYWGFTRFKLLENDEWVELPPGAYLTDALTDKAIEFITADSRAPFFLYLPYNAPHTPFHAPDDHIAKFAHVGDSNNSEDVKRRIYLAMIDVLDEGVGRILDALAETGELENTLIFFLSDNGGEPPKQGDNSPLRGGKGQLWEGGIRVPFIASWPAGWPQGVTYTSQVISLDIAATALALAGVAPDPERPPMDGVNLDPYVLGDTEGVPHDALYWRRWLDDPTEMIFAARTNEYKLIRQATSGAARLFDTMFPERDDLDLA